MVEELLRSSRPVTVAIGMLAFDADFSDLFEVRGSGARCAGSAIHRIARAIP